MRKDSSASCNPSPRRQKAAERTSVALLRYMLDNPNSAGRVAADDLKMSFPNVCRLVADFKNAGILVDGDSKQTGKRGPWSQAVKLRPDLGCSIGVDLEATQVRGLILDFAGNAVSVVRKPIGPSASPHDIVSSVAETAGALVADAGNRKLATSAIGLGLPGPLMDVGRGLVRTDLQMGELTVEFGPAVEEACGMKVTCAPNIHCFAAGHHRIHHSREKGIEMVVIDRFGLAAAMVWDGRLYTGASHYAGDLGLLPCGVGIPGRCYRDVCTGASLLKHARRRKDPRTIQELLQAPDDPLVQDWLALAIPAFAQAVYTAVILYNPHRVVIEGIFTRFSEETHAQIIEMIGRELVRTGNMIPAVGFYSGDDLMGARGAALLARDTVADDVLASIVHG